MHSASEVFHTPWICFSQPPVDAAVLNRNLVHYCPVTQITKGGKVIFSAAGVGSKYKGLKQMCYSYLCAADRGWRNCH